MVDDYYSEMFTPSFPPHVPGKHIVSAPRMLNLPMGLAFASIRQVVLPLPLALPSVTWPALPNRVLVDGIQAETWNRATHSQAAFWSLEGNEALREQNHSKPASLFAAAMTWRQPKCPSADEWIQKCVSCVCVCVCVCMGLLHCGQML